MKEIELKDGHILAPFFKESYDSCPEAFIQGVMGQGFCDSLDAPTYGVIQIGDFYYLGGDGSGAEKKDILLSILKNNLLKSRSMNMILIPLSESWNQQLEEDTEYRKATRYAFNKPKINYFNSHKLSGYISRVAYDPDYFSELTTRTFIVKPIDEDYFYFVRKQDWCKDFTANYPDYSSFLKNGFGFVIIMGDTGKIVAAASSFCSTPDSIEIEIATSPDYRRKGFGTAVGARMVLECIKRNMQPCWDAANLFSVSIAEKLGYEFLEEYVCYILA